MTASTATWNDLAAMAGAEPARAGSQGLREALEESEPLLRSLAVRLCGNDQDARDLVQDTFAHALLARDAGPANPRGYLVVILKNLFIDRCRKLASGPRVVPVECGHEVVSPEPDAEPNWARVSLSDVHAALPEIDLAFRRVYVMHVFEQRSYEEIGKALGIHRLTVGTRLTRARQRLREILCRRLGEKPAEPVVRSRRNKDSR